MFLKQIGSEVRNLGDIHWLSIEDKTPGKGTGRHIAAFILKPKYGCVQHERMTEVTVLGLKSEAWFNI